MTSAAKRTELHHYIDLANDGQIRLLFDFMKHGLEQTEEKTKDKWDDPDFVALMDRRIAELESGAVKGITWEEVKERTRNVARK